MNLFQNAFASRPRKNAFNLSHERKQTMKMAELTPFYLQEVIPGDNFRVSSETLIRMAPLIAPVMHRVNAYCHFFFVPNRIVWNNWKDFITGGEKGDFTSSFPKINITAGNAASHQIGSLTDFFGLPLPPETGATQALSVSALPYRAYQMIYNEYYRDQNLQDEVLIKPEADTVDAEEEAALLQIRVRNWEKDYLTSALPFAQKGDPVQAPIDLTYASPGLATDGVGNPIDEESNVIINSSGVIQSDPTAGGTSGSVLLKNIDPDNTGINVNDLRIAVRVQEWLEKNARAGSRYIESILSHFGERVPDYTAQRPIYLGGGKQPISISEVLQTGQTTAATDPSTVLGINSPQGNMSGHGISIGNSNAFKARFTEHGTIIGIISVLPRTSYQQAVNRSWIKFDKFQYYWPEFAQLGEQEVLQMEAYMDYNGATGQRDKTFGYQMRYGDMRYRESQACGDFRQKLAFWHMGRIFDSDPALNSEFITADPREDIFAVTDPDVHKLYVQIYNNVKALRPVPKFNNPTL